MRFIAAFLIGMLWGSPGQAVMDVGQIAAFHAGCHIDSIKKVIKEDKISSKRGSSTFEELIKQGECFKLPVRIPVTLVELLEVYTQGVSGLIIEVWRIESKERVYGLFISNPQPFKKTDSI